MAEVKSDAFTPILLTQGDCSLGTRCAVLHIGLTVYPSHASPEVLLAAGSSSWSVAVEKVNDR